MQLFRTRLVPGDLTGDLAAAWTPGWFYDGRPTGEAALVDTSGKRYPFITFNPSSADTPTWYALGYQCPAGITPGPYATDFGGTPGPQVTVEAQRPPPRSRYWEVPADGSAAVLEMIFASGRVDRRPLLLGPGRHYWDRDLDFPPGTWVDGVNARVVGVPNGRYGERLVHGGQGCTFRGVEFEPWQLVQHADLAVTGTRYLDCSFLGTGAQSLGWGMTQVHVEHCEFRGVGTGAAGLYLRNRFRGPQGGLNVGGPCDGGLCLIDNDFDGTARGPVCNTNGGPILNVLIAGSRVHGQKDDSNGGEAFLCEGLCAFDKFLIVHHRVHDSDSFGFSTWDAPIPTGGKVTDFRQDGGLGLWLAGVNDVIQTGVVIDTWELTDTLGVTVGWVDGNGRAWGHKVAGNTFTRGAVVGLRASGMLNQGNYDPDRLSRPAAFYAHVLAAWQRNAIDATVRCVNLPDGVEFTGTVTAAAQAGQDLPGL